jgi:hypothetical protein
MLGFSFSEKSGTCEGIKDNERRAQNLPETIPEAMLDAISIASSISEAVLSLIASNCPDSYNSQTDLPDVLRLCIFSLEIKALVVLG